ncbi:hypothetical protein AB0I28_27920 [Phytomonospora sp. NPDC050363]|uniref:hypothetical protein n=1 Tax=Phytomonospora sp. NPDC050363 TaxID=3155642 RepID=UPI0033D5958D
MPTDPTAFRTARRLAVVAGALLLALTACTADKGTVDTPRTAADELPDGAVWLHALSATANLPSGGEVLAQIPLAGAGVVPFEHSTDGTCVPAEVGYGAFLNAWVR